MFIHRAIESVFAQTYANWELILVNNNSMDNTIKVLTTYKNKYPEKITVLEEHKKGAPAARNKGLYFCSGEWVQFLDADDELLPEKFRSHLHLCNEHNADVIVGAYKREEGNNSTNVVNPDSDIWKGLITTRLGITSANFWRKSKLNEIGGFDENQTSSQEYELLFRLLKRSATFAFDNEVTAVVHFSSDSISRRSNSEKRKEVVRNWISLRHQIKLFLVEKGQFDEGLAKEYDQHIISKLGWFQKSTNFWFINGLINEYGIKVQLDWRLRYFFIHLKRSISILKQKTLVIKV